MTATLKEAFIALGIFLGILSPQYDPELNVRLYKSAAEVRFSLEIENGITEDIDALVHASGTVRIRVDVLQSRPAHLFRSFFHTISYDLASGIYTVYYSHDASFHTTADRDAAFRIFTGFYHLPLLTQAEFEALPVKSILFRASIGLAEEADFDPGVLWNYREPEADFNYKSLKEIPY